MNELQKDNKEPNELLRREQFSYQIMYVENIKNKKKGTVIY